MSVFSCLEGKVASSVVNNEVRLSVSLSCMQPQYPMLRALVRPWLTRVLAVSFLSCLPALHCYLPWLEIHTSLLHAIMSPDWEFIMLSGPSGYSGLCHLISDPHSPVHKSLILGVLGFPSDCSSFEQAFIPVFHDEFSALVTMERKHLGHRVSSDPWWGSIHSNRLLKKHYVYPVVKGYEGSWNNETISMCFSLALGLASLTASISISEGHRFMGKSRTTLWPSSFLWLMPSVWSNRIANTELS